VDFVDQVGEGTMLGTTPGKLVVTGINERRFGSQVQPSRVRERVTQKPLWQVRNGEHLEYWNAPLGQNYTWRIPVLTYRRCQIDQKALAGIVRTWNPGLFETAFHDLARPVRA